MRKDSLPTALERTSEYLTHPVFNRHHSEHEMLRYLRSLADKDLALDRTMIPLGSCTMKLNATSEMLPVTWPEFAQIHPFAPAEQTVGYREMIDQLEQMLVACTGYAAVSLQPNAGSQGEYAGLLIIHAYHASRGEGHRNVCLIPASAHGTNPASAQMAGMQVVVVACDAQGNVDIEDLKAKAEKHADKSRGDHDHVSVHARRVRSERARNLRDRACARRPGVRGRREHERHGRPDRAGPVRRRRLAPEPAQDLLHSARRRRTGRRSGRGRRASRASSCRTSIRPV